jgi:mRNA interferase MazF
VNLDPTIGSEMIKTRPCLIISPNEINKYLQTILIAPMTTNSKPYPSRVEVKNNNTTGWVLLDQIRTIDRVRIVKCFDIITTQEIQKIKSTIQEIYVDYFQKNE